MKKKEKIKKLKSKLKDKNQRLDNIVTLTYRLQNKLLLDDFQYANELANQILVETGL